MAQRATIEYKGVKITPNQKILIDYIVGENITEGVMYEDVRGMVGGDPLTTRGSLHRLANKKLLKKRVKRVKGHWDGALGFRKVAYFYPPDVE
jgi:hypothetical protein